MKQRSLTSDLSILNLTKLIVMCGFLAFSSTAAFGQRGTCIINNQVVSNCDLRGMDSTCTKNGQVLPCKAAPRSSCGNGGLLIIKLNSARNYGERSDTYSEMDDNLKCRGVNIGFFGAASDVTYAFYADVTYWTFTGAYTEITKKFFQVVSTKLVETNTFAFKELSETRQLLGLEGKYVTNPAEIDKHLVMGEQIVVERALDQSGYRDAIVSDINQRTKMVLDSRPQGRLSATMRAIAQVRNNKRALNRNAEYDYGNLYDRVAVGEILAANHRK